MYFPTSHSKIVSFYIISNLIILNVAFIYIYIISKNTIKCIKILYIVNNPIINFQKVDDTCILPATLL